MYSQQSYSVLFTHLPKSTLAETKNIFKHRLAIITTDESGQILLLIEIQACAKLNRNENKMHRYAPKDSLNISNTKICKQASLQHAPPSVPKPEIYSYRTLVENIRDIENIYKMHIVSSIYILKKKFTKKDHCCDNVSPWGWIRDLHTWYWCHMG